MLRQKKSNVERMRLEDDLDQTEKNYWEIITLNELE
jgi:hypothetical protein